MGCTPSRQQAKYLQGEQEALQGYSLGGLGCSPIPSPLGRGCAGAASAASTCQLDVSTPEETAPLRRGHLLISPAGVWPPGAV